MVSTLDGAVAFSGRSGNLGGPGDRLLFSVLRSLADVVLVGAGTARVERYGPAKVPLEAQGIRRQRGQHPVPTVAVVTLSGVLDWGSRLFTGGGPRPIVVTAEDTHSAALAGADDVADVIRTGTGAVDLLGALKALGERGVKPRLVRGRADAEHRPGCRSAGRRALPDPFAQANGLRGRRCWLGAGSSAAGFWPSPSEPSRKVLFGAQPLSQLVDLDLAHVVEEDSFLFLRLRARYSAGPPSS